MQQQNKKQEQFVQAVKQNDHQKVIDIGKYINFNQRNDQKLCYIIAHLHTDKTNQLIHKFFQDPKIQINPAIVAYYYYVTNNENILKNKQKNKNVQLLKGQYLFRNHKYEEALQIFMQNLKTFSKKTTLYQDILTNAVAITICDFHNPNKILLSYLGQKNISSQAKINKFLLYLKLNNNDYHKLYKQLKLGTLPQQDQLLIDFAIGQPVTKQCKGNLKMVYQIKQIICKYYMGKLTYGYLIKKFQQFVKPIYKQTLPQLLIIYTDKLILLLSKHKIQQSQKLYSFIIKFFSYQLLEQYQIFRLAQVTYLMMKGESIQPKIQREDLLKRKFIQIEHFKRNNYKLALKQLYSLITDNKFIQYKYQLCLLYLNLQPSPQQILKICIQNQNSNIILQKCLQIVTINQYSQIKKQILQNFCKNKQLDQVNKIRYAEMLFQQNWKKAFQLFNYEIKSYHLPQQTQVKSLIQQVMNIEKNIVEKNQDNVQKKKIKKKKRKPRYPKNFDPQKPGPPPNPERWLPKWQRKEYKKKKYKMNKTQGFSNVGQQQFNVFTTGGTTSNKQVVKQKKSRKKNR